MTSGAANDAPAIGLPTAVGTGLAEAGSNRLFTFLTWSGDASSSSCAAHTSAVTQRCQPKWLSNHRKTASGMSR